MSMMHLVLYTIFTETREHGHKGSGPSHHYRDKVRYGRSNEHEGYGPLHCIYRDEVRYGQSDEHDQVPRLGHTSTWLWAASLVGAAEQCDRDGRSMPV